MRCVCGKEIDHVCKLSHRERMIKYADYCVKNNIKNISCVATVTPFSHTLRGCVNCGATLHLAPHHYTGVYTVSIKNNGLLANACDDCYSKLDYHKCYINNELCSRIYCFVNMEILSICRETKPLRVLLVREIYKRHKVPHDIRNLINSLLSCAC